MSPTDKMTPDEAVKDMWDIENQFDEGGDVTFSAACDQWWVLSVFCAHSNWRNWGKGHRYVATVQVTSVTGTDVTELFTRACREFRAVHTTLEPNIKFQTQ